MRSCPWLWQQVDPFLGGNLWHVLCKRVEVSAAVTAHKTPWYCHRKLHLVLELHTHPWPVLFPVSIPCT